MYICMLYLYQIFSNINRDRPWGKVTQHSNFRSDRIIFGKCTFITKIYGRTNGQTDIVNRYYKHGIRVSSTNSLHPVPLWGVGYNIEIFHLFYAPLAWLFYWFDNIQQKLFLYKQTNSFQIR